jgi:hypothetical protein
MTTATARQTSTNNAPRPVADVLTAGRILDTSRQPVDGIDRSAPAPMTGGAAGDPPQGGAVASGAEPPERPPVPLAVIQRLWLRMTQIFGHAWTSSMGDDPNGSTGNTWRAGLAGLSPPQISTGLAACMARGGEWPPSLPSFRAMCLGIPSLTVVRADLANTSARRQPFTLLVWRHLNSWAFRHADERLAQQLLREAYEEAREHVMRGGELPVPPPELPHHAPAPAKQADPSVVAAELEAMQRLLGSGVPEVDTDVGEIQAGEGKL